MRRCFRKGDSWVIRLPLGFITGGSVGTVWTWTLPTAFRSFDTAMASLRDIFDIMLDFFSPVPADKGPALWAMKTSSVGGYLTVMWEMVTLEVKIWHLSYQTTASWNRGSMPASAMSVRVGFPPKISKNSGWKTWNGRSFKLSSVEPGGINIYQEINKPSRYAGTQYLRLWY